MTNVLNIDDEKKMKELAKEEAKKLKEAAKAEKEALRLAKKKEREAKAAEKLAAKKARQEAYQKQLETAQNGVLLPQEGTNSRIIWDVATKFSEKLGGPTPLVHVLKHCEALGLNPHTIKSQYIAWKKYHGIKGYIQAQVVVEKL